MNNNSLNDNELGQLTNFLLHLNRPVLSAEYRNHRGKKRTRYFEPIRVWYGSTDWHTEPTLLLKAFDREKGGNRDFKLSDFDMTTFTEIKTT